MRQVFLSLCCLGLLAFQAQSAEIKVATINSDIDYNTTEFYLEIKDDGTLDSLRFILKAPNGAILDDETHPSERVIRDGVVLNHTNGRDVIILRVSNFSLSKGGEVILDYLYNGATGTRRFYKFKLVKDPGGFILKQSTGQVIKGFFLYGNRTMFGLVGIKYIEAMGD